MEGQDSPIISTQGLKNIFNNEDLVIVDASGGPNGRAAYENAHLEGAVFADLETQLADVKDPVKGGRHPLPALIKFAETLGDLGISNESRVVVYDHMDGANAASRLWWMLRAIGHERVQVLDGGFQAAIEAGLPEQTENANPAKTIYQLKTNRWLLYQSDMDEVEQASKTGEKLIIDVRAPERYAGLEEPIDLIAGHIPNAVNIPFITNLDEQGRFKSPYELKNKYMEAFGGRNSDEVIVHCGSGVTACHSLLAAAHAGLEIPKLYVGSWSEWSRNNKEMVVKE